jgi:hypothetical protein
MSYDFPFFCLVAGALSISQFKGSVILTLKLINYSTHFLIRFDNSEVMF